MLKTLIIDRDPLTHQVLSTFLPPTGRILKTTLGHEGLALIRRHRPQLIFLGSNITEGASLELLSQIHNEVPDLPIFFMHQQPDHRLAVKVLRAGAYYFLQKPEDFHELPHLLHIYLRRILEKTPSLGEEEQRVFEEIVGGSSPCRKMKEDIRRFASMDVAVLILGESGTGKELVARTLHRLSSRKTAPFVAVNCGAVPFTLFESELFGCRRGAYTGAVNRQGYFERSRGGTLFLDEIAEISSAGQAKLLRVLDEKVIFPLGSCDSHSVDTRILTATNRPLQNRIKNGRFRMDLLFRINTATITVPPLRKRKEDIPLLSDHFLRTMTYSDKNTKISVNALEKLSNHDWPGNIRELKNVVERAAIRCSGPVIRPHNIDFFNLTP